VDASDGVWGVIVALIGLVSVIYTGRRGPREPPTAIEIGEADPDKATAEQLQVSPAIWKDMRGEIRELRTKVDHLTDLVEQGSTRERTLRDHLRMAMHVIRRANRRLRSANQPEEPVPTELIQYSLD